MSTALSREVAGRLAARDAKPLRHQAPCSGRSSKRVSGGFTADCQLIISTIRAPSCFKLREDQWCTPTKAKTRPLLRVKCRSR